MSVGQEVQAYAVAMQESFGADKAGHVCGCGAVEVLAAMARFIDEVEAYTVPTSEGRKFASIYADLAASESYDRMASVVLPAFLRALGSAGVRTDSNPDELGVEIWAARVGVGGLAADLIAPFNMWNDATAWPAQRVGDADGSAAAARRFQFGEVVPNDMLVRMRAAHRAMQLHVARHHSEGTVGEVQVAVAAAGGTAGPATTSDSRHLGIPDVPKARRKAPGRTPVNDPKADARIADSWSTRRFKRYEDLARELNLPERTVELALGRHRKRLRASSRVQSSST